ncbi:MAG: type II secretion system F family protein [Chitinivorax sp.]
MQQFEVKALKAQSVVVLRLDAASSDDARNQATQQGVWVISVHALRQGWMPAWRAQRFNLVLFTQELLALLDAGLSLIEAVETLAEKAHDESQDVLRKLTESLYQGQSLSQALQHFPQAFPELYVASVRASEKTGDIVPTLQRFVTYQQQADTIRKQIISASIYPAVVFVVGIVVALFLLIYLVPKFSRIYEDMNTDLPFLSRMLLKWGSFASDNMSLVLLGIGGITALVVYAASNAEARARALTLLWRIQSLRERWYLVQLSRLYRSAGMLLRGGIPAVTAFSMVGGLLHPTLRPRLDKAISRIREGQPISLVMQSCELTTPVAVRMLRVGEKSGKMGDMMERIALFYDEDTARWVDVFTRVFPPLLLLIIALFIGTIVVSMYMPIFELAGGLQ